MEEKNKAIDEELVEEKDTQVETEPVETDNGQSTNELLEKNNLLQSEKEETYNRLLRLQAEFDNYKKRTLKEREADRKYKAQDLVQELLPAIDNFERALQIEVTNETKSLFEGITMVHKQLIEALKSQGVEIIETEGKDFDPNLHHAVMQVEDDSIESDKIVEELQKGYMINDRVIRPAMVKVNK